MVARQVCVSWQAHSANSSGTAVGSHLVSGPLTSAPGTAERVHVGRVYHWRQTPPAWRLCRSNQLRVDSPRAFDVLLWNASAPVLAAFRHDTPTFQTPRTLWAPSWEAGRARKRAIAMPYLAAVLRSHGSIRTPVKPIPQQAVIRRRRIADDVSTPYGALDPFRLVGEPSPQRLVVGRPISPTAARAMGAGLSCVSSPARAPRYCGCAADPGPGMNQSGPPAQPCHPFRDTEVFPIRPERSRQRSGQCDRAAALAHGPA